MTDSKPVGKRKHRSPSYPYLNLQEAINMANELYKKESRHKIPVEVAIADLGYSPTSGSGLRVLAALLNFGLLSEEGASEGRKVGLSDLGKSIVMDTRPLS